MSFFSGYSFFVCLAILLVPAIILGLLEKSLRWYRLVLTLFFIWMIYRETPVQLIYLAAYTIVSCYIVKIYL